MLMTKAKRDLRRLLVPRRWEPNALVVSDLADILDFAADRLVLKGDTNLTDFVQSLRERAKIARVMAADHGFAAKQDGV